jgi:uncharacterized protein YjbI with pentapeptide repeats
MAGTADIGWETCSIDGCIGVRPGDAEGCLVHDQQHRDAALQRLGKDGHIDARGVRIDADLLAQIFAAAPEENSQPVLQAPQFDRATFTTTAHFNRTESGEYAYSGPTFKGEAGFRRTTFEGEADFGGATFEGMARFDRATFRGGAGFGWATFKGGAMPADFHFGGTDYNADFRWATFKGGADFRGATFEGEARFDQATFGGETGFRNTTFKDSARFDEARFEQAREYGPMLVRYRLSLDDATFRQRVLIQANAQTLSCERARFPAGVQFRLRWACVTLDDADLAAPAILVGVPALKGSLLGRGVPILKGAISEDFDEGDLLAGWRNEPPGPPRPPGQPWVASLRRANVAGLAIANADLQACRFAGAQNLDRLGLESPKAFTATPGLKAVTPGLKAVTTGWAWPPIWWWTRRQTLAEEHAWRADHERGIRQAGWHADQAWPATIGHWVPVPSRSARGLGRLERYIAQAVRDWRRPHQLRRRLALAWRIGAARAGWERTRRQQAVRMRQQQARETANLYRALRKAREDAKDEPGAADFYYGEMEMRRHAAPRFSVERVVLTAYWLVAGYALRAWRAVAALAAVLVLAAWLLAHRHGFAAPQAMTFWSALRYSGRTAIGLLPKDQPTLTPWGDVVQIAVRVVVPVLLGLAVLSLRGRVKR